MSISEERTIELADELAWHLFEAECDAGELKKSLDYYRTSGNRIQFFQMVSIRSRESELFQRSNKTRLYYRKIDQKIRNVLGLPGMEFSDDLRVLGWAFRLMQYYDEMKPTHPVTRQSSQAIQKPITQDRPAKSQNRRTGIVKWFDGERKGYGYIKPNDGGNDVFVHISQTPGRRGLQEKQRVSFVMGKGPQGREQAQDVQAE